MRIEGSTIIFKSIPSKFSIEKAGLKPNTVRRITFWSELREFENFYLNYKHSNHSENYRIRIVNSLTGENFTRNITDISEFEGLWIFSWMIA